LPLFRLTSSRIFIRIEIERMIVPPEKGWRDYPV